MIILYINILIIFYVRIIWVTEAKSQSVISALANANDLPYYKSRCWINFKLNPVLLGVRKFDMAVSGGSHISASVQPGVIAV